MKKRLVLGLLVLISLVAFGVSTVSAANPLEVVFNVYRDRNSVPSWVSNSTLTSYVSSAAYKIESTVEYDYVNRLNISLSWGVVTGNYYTGSGCVWSVSDSRPWGVFFGYKRLLQDGLASSPGTYAMVDLNHYSPSECPNNNASNNWASTKSVTLHEMGHLFNASDLGSCNGTNHPDYSVMDRYDICKYPTIYTFGTTSRNEMKSWIDSHR